MQHAPKATRIKSRSPGTRVTWLWAGVALVAFGILALEFIFDLANEPGLYWIAIALDFALVASFFAYILFGAYKARANLWPWFQAEKANLILLLFIVPALFAPRFAAAMVIARALFGVGMNLFYTPLGKRLIANLNLRPSQTLALSFVGLIFAGTLLLMFPAATVDGKGALFLDAIFTITSAACVVGLSVVDIGDHFSFFGQAVILAAIQIGGLGIMVMSASFALMMGNRLQARTQTGLAQLVDVSTPEGVRNLVKSVAVITLFAESVGALALFVAFSERNAGDVNPLWWAIFHSISAFCNAGFGLAADSMSGFVSDFYVCGVIMALMTLGGMGFFVISDLMNPLVWEIKRVGAIWQRLQIQTRVALIATLFLNVLGLLFFLFFEFDGALLGLSIPEKIWASLFQAMSARTAGFFTVPMGTLAPATVLFMMAWMFVGANPGSTGGGIKTTTAAVAIMAVRAMLLGREDVEMFGRRIPSVIVNRALSIIFVAVLIIGIFLMILLATQPLSSEKLTFEAVSAFGTVGLSMDLTKELTPIGRICIILIMFAGRIGPLTLAMAIGERTRTKQYTLPEGHIAVG